jgi:hypothetical protein
MYGPSFFLVPVRATVPRITPNAEAAFTVGELEKFIAAPYPSRTFARPKSNSFTLPSSVILMFAGFISRWMIPFSCAGLQRVTDLLCDKERFVERQDATSLENVGKRVAFD